MGNEFDSQSMQPCMSSKRAVKLHHCHDKDARRNLEGARAATNNLEPARDRRRYEQFSLINEIKIVYLMSSFLIASAYIEVRYSRTLDCTYNHCDSL